MVMIFYSAPQIIMFHVVKILIKFFFKTGIIWGKKHLHLSRKELSESSLLVTEDVLVGIVFNLRRSALFIILKS